MLRRKGKLFIFSLFAALIMYAAFLACVDAVASELDAETSELDAETSEQDAPMLLTLQAPAPTSTGILGDINCDGYVDSNDAIYLLMYLNFPDDYQVPSDVNVDMDNDGNPSSNDAIYLLMHTQFPDDYPLHEAITPHERVYIGKDGDASNENYAATVKEMQDALIALGYQGARGITIDTDGIYDYDLMRIIAYYQIVHDIYDPDGCASPGGNTWYKIDQELVALDAGTYAGYEAYERVNIAPGMDDSSLNAKRTLKELAFCLNCLGFKTVDGNTLAQDGIYSAAKIAPVKEFQHLYSLGPDGVLSGDGGTWAMIDKQMRAYYEGTYSKPTYTRTSIWLGIDYTDKNVKYTISEVQYKLIALGYSEVCGYTIDNDGVFDYELLKTIAYYQIVNGIAAPDGSAGVEGTIKKICEQYDNMVLGADVSFTPYVRVDVYSGSDQTSLNAKRTIIELEWSLKTLGYTYADGSEIKEDATYSTKLSAVVKEFQELNGDSNPDGILGAKGWTWKKIDEQIRAHFYGQYTKPSKPETEPVTPTVETWKIIVTASSLNVRKEAGTNGALVTTIAKDSIHTASKTTTGSDGSEWTYLDDVSGWVKSEFIKKYDGSTSQTEIKIDNSGYAAGSVANCGKDENNGYFGGEAGDQTGTEFWVINWYNYGQDYVLRYTGERADEVRALIAQYAIAAANNNHIGYDQGQRDTFWNMLVKYGYNPANIKEDCEADCSSSVASIIKAVGYTLGIQSLKDVWLFATYGERSALTSAGFSYTTSSSYLSSSNYLLAGDIILNTSKHTNICIKNGIYASDQSKWSSAAEEKPSYSWEVTINTESDPLNVRSGAGTSYSIVGSVAKGSVHTATKTAYDSNNEKWTYLYDVGGWVKTSFLK